MADSKFNYSYSPARNDEVDRIAAKYLNVEKKPDSDLERLRMLDRKAERPGTFAGIAVGIIGVLIMGTGISLILSFDHFIAGVIVGVLGLGVAAAATPVSKAVTKKSREKVRDEVLALTEKIKRGG